MNLKFKKQIPLASLTTAGVGGPADFFYKARAVEKLKEAVSFTKNKKIPYFILGSGSNILVSDKGFPGLIIKNEIKGILGFKQIIKAGSGTLLSKLVSTTIRQNLSGLQKLAGIPGTIGGAIYGNAGAYGVSIGDTVTKVVAFDSSKEKTVSFTKKQCRFNYRDSIFKKNGLIILEAHFKLSKLPGETLEAQAKEVSKQRQAKYFWQGKNPGSFFKNIPLESLSKESLKLIPKDKIVYGKVPAGFLLESVGAKGIKVGGVEVSKTHANLLINTGSGRASDFIELATILSKKVKEKYGIILESEVQFLGIPPLSF